MSQWDGRSKGTTLGYRIFIALLKTGGLRSAYVLLKLVKLYYIWMAPRVTTALRSFYKERLHYSGKESRRLISRNIEIFGQTIIDKIATMSGVETSLSVERTGEEYLNELAQGGKGGILVSAHLGNYEMAGHLLKRYNTIINIVMYDGEAQQLKAYLDQVTGPKTFNIIYVREDLSHIYEMSAALQRNELICIHADRYLPGNRTIAHDFLGESALFPLGPFVLASKLNAPVCFVFAFKKSSYRYHFYGFRPKTYAGRGLTGAQAMLEDYVQLLEVYVKKYPEQWFNYYDFWEKNTETELIS